MTTTEHVFVAEESGFNLYIQLLFMFICCCLFYWNFNFTVWYLYCLVLYVFSPFGIKFCLIVLNLLFFSSIQNTTVLSQINLLVLYYIIIFVFAATKATISQFHKTGPMPPMQLLRKGQAIPGQQKITCKLQRIFLYR